MSRTMLSLTIIGAALLDQVMEDVAGRCRDEGMATHWDVFRDKVLLPIMDDSESPSLDLLCEKYRLSNKAKASKMIIIVKRRFRPAIRRHLRRFVNSDDEVDEEIRHLVQAFCKGRGRS